MDHTHHGHNDHASHTNSAVPGDTPMDALSPFDFDNMQDAAPNHGGHEHNGGNMEHMMSMAFHFGYNETVLFSWWKIDTIAGLIASMIAIFVVAALYEGLKYYREYLFWKTCNLLEYRPVSMRTQRGVEEPQINNVAANSSLTSPMQYVGEVIHKQPPTMMSRNHLYQSFLHMLQVTISLLLMLVFMTYNVWLCLPVVVGAGLGYFLFCWKKAVIMDVNEHCH